MDDPRRVAVIGSGPAGAAAAQTLADAGFSVTVFERDMAIGGRTQTYRADGYQLDTGAAFITNFYPRVWGLATTLGYESEICQLNRVTGLSHDGRMATLDIGSPWSFFSFPFVKLVDKLKMLLWTLGLFFKRKTLDIGQPSTLVAYDSETVSDFVKRTLNERILDFLVRPGIEPFWYFSCDDVSAGLAAGLTAHAPGARFYYFKDGIDRVSHHLLAKTTVKTGTTVKSVMSRVGGVRLSIEGEGTTFEQDFAAVIIATTANVAVELIGDAWTDLGVDASCHAFIETQRYVANIHVAFIIERLAERPQISSLFPVGPGRHSLAALSFHGVKDKNAVSMSHELISVYLSDEESWRLMTLDDETTSRRCYELAQTVYPNLPDAYSVFKITRRPYAIPIHEVGRYRKAALVNQGQKTTSSSVLFCGDYLATATVDGAIHSGQLAAETLIQRGL